MRQNAERNSPKKIAFGVARKAVTPEVRAQLRMLIENNRQELCCSSSAFGMMNSPGSGGRCVLDGSPIFTWLPRTDDARQAVEA